MDELRKWREGLPAGFRTFVAAGKLLGVTGVQMYRYETGKRRVPPEKVKAIARITKIKPAVLRPDIFGKAGPDRLKRRRPKTEAHPG